MIRSKILPLAFCSILNLSIVLVANSSSLKDDLNTEIQKAGCASLVLETPTNESQPLLSKYATQVQAFINTNQEVVTDSSYINRTTSLLGSEAKDQLHLDLYQAFNSLMSVFDALNIKSPKSHFEATKRLFDETTQNLTTVQLIADASANELKTANASSLLKEQKIEGLENSIRSLIEIINPSLFNIPIALTEEQKTQESVRSTEQITAYLKQTYPTFIPS